MEVKHRKGKDQGNADFLSRLEHQPDGTYTVQCIGSKEIRCLGKHTHKGKEKGEVHLQMIRESQQSDRGFPCMWVVPKPALMEGSIAVVEHQKVNQAFLDKLKGAQKSDKWLQQVREVMVQEGIVGLPREYTSEGAPTPEVQEWVKANLIVEVDGILIRCAEKATGRESVVRRVDTILVPESLRKELVEMLHHHPAHGHRGWLSTYRIVTEHYFWPGMQQDIRQTVAECETCQARRAKNVKTPYRARPLPQECFQTISLDFAGPFGKNVPGNHYKYCLCIVDNLSRFPILVPCKTTKAEVVIKALQERVYADFGMPETIILDRAGSLKGTAMAEHAKQNGIQLEFIAADNHRANGLAERTIREFNDRMNLTCKDHWKKWHLSVKETELALRTTPCADTGISPAEMVFGRPMRTTFNGLFNVPELEEDAPRRRSARLLAKRVRAMTKLQPEEQDIRPNAPQERTFIVGEQVRFKTDTEGKNEGLPARWFDTFGGQGIIKEVLPNDQYLVENIQTGNEIIRSRISLAKILQRQ